MKNIKKASILPITVVAFFISSCENRTEDIPASYASHKEYINLNCSQISTKMEIAKVELLRYSSRQNAEAFGDNVGVFLILIPPSVLFGNNNEAGVAKWKGVVEAIKTTQNTKKCGSRQN